MVIGVISLLLIAGIAYWHWAQGLFSAALSLAFAVVASTVALGYSEFVVASVLGGKMADMANGMVICGLFLLVYGVGRVVFDSLIPGNVRLPLYVDKVGGLLCGFVAGAFAVGTILVAVQSFPFGTSFALGFSRYPVAEERSVTVPGRRNEVDAMLRDMLDLDPGTAFPSESKRNSLMVFPADEFVLSYLSKQSAGGSLAGTGTAFDQVHPDLLREVFFQRVGIEPAAKHTAMNVGGRSEVAVPSLFAPPRLNQRDGELAGVRGGQNGSLVKAPAGQAAQPGQGSPTTVLQSSEAARLLVVRSTIKPDAAEKDGRIRFSTGAARLVVGGKEYYPIGTLHVTGDLLMLNRIDDFLLAEKSAGGTEAIVDFVYQLDAGAITNGKLKPGSFFEFKRYGRVDLSDKDVTGGAVPPQVKPDPENKTGPGGVMRKTPLLRELNPQP